MLINIINFKMLRFEYKENSNIFFELNHLNVIDKLYNDMIYNTFKIFLNIKYQN